MVVRQMDAQVIEQVTEVGWMDEWGGSTRHRLDDVPEVF